MEKEIWKIVKNTDNHYKISSFGRLMGDLDKSKQGWYFINGTKSKNGYLRVRLRVTNRFEKINVRLHTLTAQYFIENPNPEDFNSVKHKDKNKTNNHHTNLYWSNKKDIIDEAILNKTRVSGPGQKLSLDDVIKIRTDYDNIPNMTINQLAKNYKVGDNAILSVLKYITYDYVEPHKKLLYQINNPENVEFREYKENLEAAEKTKQKINP